MVLPLLVVRVVLEVLGIRAEHRFLVFLGFQPLPGLLEIQVGLEVLVVPVGKACMVVEWWARRGQSVACLGLRVILALLVFRVCRAFREVLVVRAVLADSIRRRMGPG